MVHFVKYPRTLHIEGSRLQVGDEGHDVVPFSRIATRHLVIEEKMDGANCGIRFTADGQLLLQSRGHYLTGGGREAQFDLLKQWATTHCADLWDVLGDRYVMYGEWLYAKHTIFYDDLPHYFMEFDVFDTANGEFLDTPRRNDLLLGLPIVSVRVLHEGAVATLTELQSLVGASAFKTPFHLERLQAWCLAHGLDIEVTLSQSDPEVTMEGLYIKVEENGVVTERYKFVRASFLQTVQHAESHWSDRPLIPNQLRPGITFYE